VLAKRASEISAGEVLRAVEESLELVPCVSAEHETTCHRADECSTHLLWKRVGDAVAEVVDTVTLAELCTNGEQQ